MSLSLRGGLFARLFGVAIVAHVVGNWSQPDLPHPVGWVNFVVGLVGIWLAIRPSRPVLLLAALATVVSVALEMPFTGNHWLVAGLIGAGILVTGGNEKKYLPASRWILLIFYGFAAFAKLNSGFLDPSVSCAVFYGNQSLASYGLPLIDPSSSIALVMIWGTVVVEASVPLLLIWKRTRYFGVLLGSTFHTVISFDLNQHFYDFTAVLLMLFFLFIPDSAVQSVLGVLSRTPGEVRKAAPWAWAGVGGALVVMAVLPLTQTNAAVLSRLPFAFWIPFSLAWVGVLVWAWAPGTSVSWKPGLAAGLVIAATLLNGLTPYTELKTAYGFNMYANLMTASGESNHLVVRSTVPLRDGYTHPIEIISSSDPDLQSYQDLGYLIAEPQLRRYLSSHPDVSLSFRQDGSVVTLERAGDSDRYSDPGPWWWRFFPLRAIDTQRPPRCQDLFLAAL